ncbi:hypothetical protein [Natronobacterium gregoryi]|uniref:Uncharacterized protein n=2 Tax=Natronobacterium gregoryi TaxID=44930 RepID=L0AMH1_NATGS|nr:hypothetical protein [Natronobacterium gregoryi]AFZ74392.1 hypothetical protein Natgr_3263 [Natronobacterium gregoryi SP2]SFJ61515.1 hypothetical protein SAMN05443661_14618 [Natronobacterium gregoryi]
MVDSRTYAFEGTEPSIHEKASVSYEATAVVNRHTALDFAS